MNIHKNMESIFVVVLVVLNLGSFALDYLPAAQAKPPAVVVVAARSTATPTSMAVVVIKARRPARWLFGATVPGKLALTGLKPWLTP